MRRLLIVLPIILLTLTPHELTFGQMPTPTAVAALSQASPPVPGPAKSLPELILGNLGAILAGVAGVIAAVVSYFKSIRTVKNDFISWLGERASIELIKNQGHFWDTTETRPFETALTEQLVKYKTALKLIEKHGPFVTNEKLKEIKDDIAKYVEMLRKQEGDLTIFTGKVSTLERSNEDPRAKEEQAKMVIEILRKEFSK